MKNWFAITASSSGSLVIDIFDEIGMFGITAKDFVAKLRAAGTAREITLNIDCPGGDCNEGFTMYDALIASGAQITVNITGLAASMASVIMLAGNKIRIAENGRVMIHRVTGGARGNADEMDAAAKVMKQFEDRIVGLYVARSGKDETEIRELMKAQMGTWFFGEEAIAAGFADELMRGQKAAAFQPQWAAKFTMLPAALFSESPVLRSSESEGRIDTGAPATPSPASSINMKALLALASLIGITVKGDETEDQLTAAIVAHKPQSPNVVIDFEDAAVKAAFTARITEATKDDKTKLTALETSRWIDGLKYNGLDQLELIRLNQDDTAFGPSAKFTDIPAINPLGGRNVFHLKDTKRLNQYHGDPAIFASGKDLLSYLDLKALRTHSATVRSALLGASTTKDGKVLNAMASALAAGQTGSPAADSGARFVEIKEGAVVIPLATDEAFNFFNSTTEAVPFKQILEDMLNPFIFELKYPPEWIFMRGKVGGVEYRGLLQQVSRAHEGLRSRLYALLQWIWEKVIGTAMLPNGALAKYAAVEDWNAIDFVTDPDPTVDAGRNHQADMDRYGENLLPAADYVERLNGGDGDATRHQAIDDRIDSVKYAISIATGTPIDQVVLPAAIATIIGLGIKTCQAASGLISSLAPDSLAQVLTAMDGNPPPAAS